MARQGLLLIVLAVSALTCAMVPRPRRSLPEDEVSPSPQPNPTNNSTTPVTTEVCDRQTPCAWSVYTRFTRVHEFNISNHCLCSPEQTCKYFDDDISISAYVYRCQPLS